MCITSFLGSIPDIIWSGVIASVLTMSGVLISNRSNTMRLRIQLKHDSDEKVKERTASLRKEVYLETVSELVKANSHLASLPQLDITKINLSDGMQGFFASSARLQLVAEPKTALLLNQFSAEYGVLVFKLIAYLMPVSTAKADIQIANDLYSEAQVEVKRILGEMNRLNESGESNPLAFSALQSSFDFYSEQSNKYADELATAWDRFNRGNVEFQKFLFSWMRDMAPKQVPVMVEIRRDLGLTGSLNEMELQLQHQMQKMEESFDALISSLQND